MTKPILTQRHYQNWKAKHKLGQLLRRVFEPWQDIQTLENIAKELELALEELNDFSDYLRLGIKKNHIRLTPVTFIKDYRPTGAVRLRWRDFENMRVGDGAIFPWLIREELEMEIKQDMYNVEQERLNLDMQMSLLSKMLFIVKDNIKRYKKLNTYNPVPK